MIPLLLASVLAADVSFQARLPRTALEVGMEYELEVDLDLPGVINPHYAWDESFEPGGLRRPFLLLDVPDCVELVGEVPDPLVTPGDFQLSFSIYPYGRRLFAANETVRFRLVAEPGRREVIGLNLVVYTGELGSDDEVSSGFVRLRAELDLRRGASAEGKPSSVSSWGKDPGVQIGDEAPGFELPALDGSSVTLASVAEGQNVLLLFYRGET